VFYDLPAKHMPNDVAVVLIAAPSTQGLRWSSGVLHIV
jgi:hypothetical protein